MKLIIHENIMEKLKYFHSIHKIPNILFNGPSGSGKSTLVNDFISLIYDGNKDKIRDLVMYVNCAHGKGIKFIREELKFFAKTQINSNGGGFVFKSIILFNADKLTMDAQSALRRCIELFSFNTRFFLVVEDKYKLLRPILSRFCEIYIAEPIRNGKEINLYEYNLEQTFHLKDTKTRRLELLKKEWKKMDVVGLGFFGLCPNKMLSFVTKLYEKAYNALDVIKLTEDGFLNLELEKRYELLILFNKAKKEIRNEKLLLLFVVHFITGAKATDE